MEICCQTSHSIKECIKRLEIKPLRLEHQLSYWATQSACCVTFTMYFADHKPDSVVKLPKHLLRSSFSCHIPILPRAVKILNVTSNGIQLQIKNKHIKIKCNNQWFHRFNHFNWLLFQISNLFQKDPPVHQTITEQEILLKLIIR